MLPESKKKVQAALKRLSGLQSKLEQMVQEDAYCADVLHSVLTMEGHLKHIRGMVLESHLHTCAPTKLASTKDKHEFISELMNVIGLSAK